MTKTNTNRHNPADRLPLKEQLRPYIPKDVPSTVCCLEKTFMKSVYRFFPGRGRQIIYQEDGHLGPRAEAKGDKVWITCYNRLWRLLNKVSCLPYASYITEVSFAEYLLCVSDLIECTEEKIGAAYGDTYDFECGYDEISERMLSIMKILYKSNPHHADSITFLQAPFSVYREACDEIVKKYPCRTAPNFDRQSGYLHKHVDKIPFIAGQLDEALTLVQGNFRIDFLKKSTVNEVLAQFDHLYDRPWTPDLDIELFFSYEYALWVWLYDEVLKPLMQAAAAFYYHRNHADRSPVPACDGKRMRDG